MSNDSEDTRFGREEAPGRADGTPPSEAALPPLVASVPRTETPGESASARVRSEQAIAASRANPAPALGRGLDIGTANLLTAAQDESGQVTVKRERNAFLEIPPEVSGNQEVLTKLDVPYVRHRDRFYVLGDVSFQLANMFDREVRRPMRDGFLSPTEQDAIPILKFLLDRLLGPPAVEGEPVCFCVPAPSIDRENDIRYHEGIVCGVLSKIGYTPKSMSEGHAVVCSEFADHGFTGIGISCGGGMFNVCVAHATIPVVTFSVTLGGDWIDRHVARATGIQRTRATAIKESEIDLTEPKSREEEAVVLYHRHLISYVLQNLRQRLRLARDLPQFTEPVEIVVAGGTSLVGGFVEVFAEELTKVDFPVPIAGVRRGADPMTSVVRGTLIAAALAND
ncbi:MAG: cell division protein FtsA [Planctomycetota bacterium]